MTDDIASVVGGSIRLGRSPKSGETLIGNANNSFTLTPAPVPTRVAFGAYSAVNQALAAGVYTTVVFGTTEFDTNSNFASNAFTPTVPGYYQINASVFVTPAGGLVCFLMKNGTYLKYGIDVTAGYITNLSSLVYANGTDVFTVQVYCSVATVIQAGQQGTYFNGFLALQ